MHSRYIGVSYKCLLLARALVGCVRDSSAMSCEYIGTSMFLAASGGKFGVLYTALLG